MEFLELEEVLRIHARTIEEHGGSHGLRDKGALESALHAPFNRFNYEDATLEVCAATYAYHLSQAHAFIDGNKRIGHAALEVFLLLNGFEIAAEVDEQERIVVQLAASVIGREEFTAWLERHTVERIR